MKRNLISLAMASCLAAVLAGCESTAARQPKTTEKAALVADRVTPDIELEVVEAVEITLPAGPAGSGGFVWEITSNNVRVLEQMGPVRPGPVTSPSNAPSATISFYALRPGRSVLRFALIRPGEAEATPAAKCQVTVVVSD